MLSECSSQADVVFVLDSSGSLDEPNFEHIKNFVSNLVTDLDIDGGKIRVGVVTYSDYAEPRFNLNRYNTRYPLIISCDCSQCDRLKKSGNKTY